MEGWRGGGVEGGGGRGEGGGGRGGGRREHIITCSLIKQKWHRLGVAH